MDTMLGKEGPLRTETRLRVVESPRCGSDVWATEEPVFLRKAGRCALAQLERRCWEPRWTQGVCSGPQCSSGL